MRWSITLILLIALVLPTVGAVGSPPASGSRDLAVDLLEDLTPEERVGQLFLVTFNGSEITPASPILALIQNYHISGVLLQSETDNFDDTNDTQEGIKSLVTALQDLELSSSQAEGVQAGAYIPLLIGISQEGNGAPYSQIMTGSGGLPSEMSIGATWDPEIARATGELLGQELNNLGLNLLLGPTLDVLADPLQGGAGGLGVRTFGGDPYWVSEMGRAYIAGLHAGAEGRIAVISKHFPGLGGSDRPIEEEVATVRKSLVQLEQIELAPFLAVTAGIPGVEPDVTDGLLVSHIRYQGFQGNIRDTTRPVSLDPEAFGQLIALDTFREWRENGGVTVSDSLGSGAVRRFYESLGSEYKPHLVARDAFLAGNDLLLLKNFVAANDPDQATTIRSTLEFFTQKYREDPVFSQRVDEAVLRILNLKERLFGPFDQESVFPSGTPLDLSQRVRDLSLQVARTAATLISPGAEEVRDRLGGPPQLGERVVFITDVRMYRQCSGCDFIPGIDRRALEARVLALYGQQAAGQVGSWNLTSYTFADLAVFLGYSPPSVPVYPISGAEEIREALVNADWLVFVMLDSSPSRFGSQALKILLDERPDLLREKNVVVFAHDVPYELDATDISKLDAYYALYAKGPPFLEIAARLLFLEIAAPGASPVSIPGIGYDMIRVTAPDPNQIITLSIQKEPLAEGEGQEGYSIGDVLTLETGTILDLNGKPVPDRTPVNFILTYPNENISFPIERTMLDGKGAAAFTLDRLGLLTIRVESDPARASAILQLNVQEGEPATVTILSPTSAPTLEVLPTETALAQDTATPPSTPVVEPSAESPMLRPSLADLLLSVLAISALCVAGYRYGPRYVQGENPQLKSVLFIIVGGLAAYNFLSIGVPGSNWVMDIFGLFAGVLIGALGGTAGYLVGALVSNGGKSRQGS